MRNGAYCASLDGLRAISILLVLGAHAGFGRVVPGGLGVTIFFFISGFLITGQLVDEHRARGAIGLARFYVRRALRLVPVFAVYVAIAGLVFTMLGGRITAIGWAAALLHTGNYAALFTRSLDSNVAGLPHPFSILWSLAVEEHAYLIWPALLMVLLARTTTMHRAIAAMLALIVLTLVWRCHLAPICAGHQGLVPPVCGIHADDRIYKATDTRIDSIAFGALAALLARADGGIERSFASATRNMAVVAAALGFLALTLAFRDTLARDTWRCTAQGMALLIVAPGLAVMGGGIGRALSARWLVAIGRASYGLYLWHWLALIVATHLILARFSAPGGRLVFLAVFAGLTAVFSIASWYGIERPMMRLRRRAGSHVPTPIARPSRTRRIVMPRLATLLAGSVGGQVAAIAMAPLLARIYGLHAWGEFGIFTAIATLAASVACLGFEPAILLAHDERDRAHAYGTSVLLAAAAALLPALALLLVRHDDPMLLLACASVLALGIGRASANRALAMGNPRAVAAGRLCRSLGVGIVQLGLGVFAEPDALSLALGAVAGQMLAAAVTMAPLGWEGRPRLASLAGQRDLCRRHISLLAWSAPQTLLNAVGNAAVPLVLARAFGADAVGAFTLATRIVAIPAATIGEALRQHMLAAMAACRSDDAALGVMARAWGLGIAAAAIPVVAVFAVIAHPLVAMAFGPGWGMAADFASLLLAAEAAGIANIPAATAIVVRGWQAWLLAFQALTLPIRIGALIVVATMINAIAAYAALSIMASLAVSIAVAAALRTVRFPTLVEGRTA